MPISTELAMLGAPEECQTLTKERAAVLDKEADELINGKDAPHLLLSCAGVAYFVNMLEPKPMTFGGDEDDDTKIGFTTLFVIKPELLGPKGIEQLYFFIQCVNAMNERYFKGKADKVFLKRGDGDETSVKPLGSLYINLKKTFPKDDPAKPPKPPKLYAADAKTIIPMSELTEGSLIRVQLWAGPPLQKSHGKLIWGGSIYTLQLLHKNEGNIQVSALDAPLAEIAPPEDDADSIKRYASLRAEALPAPEPNPGGDTGGGDMDDEIPF